MKALFWKEFRENLKWAVLAMGIIIAAMAYSLQYNPSNYYSFQNNVWQGLQSSQFLMITVFGFPVVGLALGFLQILTELRRDQWAFLIHRPVTRRQVFWGKAIPGSLLYIVATGIPLAGTAWWLAQPGSAPAPFDIRQIIPGLVDLLTGLCFYFAALLSGILSGPWYGRRSLPLVAACFATTSAKTYLLCYALSGVVLVLVCLIAAAAAIHSAAGLFRRASVLGKAATVLVYLFAASIFTTWFWVGWKIVFPPKPYSSTSYAVFKTGEVVVVHQRANWYESVVTLDGREIKPEKTTFDWRDFINPTYLYLKSQRPYSDFHSARTYFQQVYTQTSSPYLWYYVVAQDCFQAFSIIGKTPEGFLGPDGFAPANDPGRAGRFDIIPSGYFTDNIVTTHQGLFVPDFNGQTIKMIFAAPDGQKIVAGSVSYDPANPEGPPDYAAATDTDIYFILHSGKQVKVPITVDTNKYRGASVFQTKDGYMIRYDSWFPKLDPQLVMASPDGNITSQRSLPSLEKPQTVSLRERISEALNPLGTGIWQQVNVWGFHSLGMDDSTPFWTWKPKDRNEVLFSWMISALVGLACAGVLQLPLRRAEFRCQRLGWTLFVIFYGVAGLLAFWIANDWPRRIACPSCSRKRSVERETCEHCGAGWPAPKQDGTEIWEGLTEEATPPAAR